ncbi:hypothetical protein ACO2Q2_14860 [Dyella sp. KRB-257]|uniref:hypothetical protein n=1 Tax=Dyella sp. KRB-257 TaxID=3400915 RepID=UPI003BFF831F
MDPTERAHGIRFYQALLNDALATGDSVVLLRGEVTSVDENPRVSERIDLKHGIATNAMVKFGKQAQAGYRMAVVLPDADAGLRFLESRGYERCATSSPGSAEVIRGWEAWLEQHLPDAKSALVFGHDYEPAFIFERSRRVE